MAVALWLQHGTPAETSDKPFGRTPAVMPSALVTEGNVSRFNENSTVGEDQSPERRSPPDGSSGDFGAVLPDFDSTPLTLKDAANLSPNELETAFPNLGATQRDSVESLIDNENGDAVAQGGVATAAAFGGSNSHDDGRKLPSPSCTSFGNLKVDEDYKSQESSNASYNDATDGGREANENRLRRSLSQGELNACLPSIDPNSPEKKVGIESQGDLGTVLPRIGSHFENYEKSNVSYARDDSMSENMSNSVSVMDSNQQSPASADPASGITDSPTLDANTNEDVELEKE